MLDFPWSAELRKKSVRGGTVKGEKDEKRESGTSAGGDGPGSHHLLGVLSLV